MENEPPKEQASSWRAEEGWAPGSACAGRRAWCAARAGSSWPRRWCSEKASGRAPCYFSEEIKTIRKESAGSTEPPHKQTKRGAHLSLGRGHVALEAQAQVVSRLHQVLGGADQHLVHGPCCWPRGPHDGVTLGAQQDRSALSSTRVSWWASNHYSLEKSLASLDPSERPPTVP